MKNYDLIVIGSGAGGLTATFTALGFGKSVLVIEKDRPGGECTWSGCIPSKSLINQAKAVHTARKFADIQVDGASIMANVRAVSERIYEHETPEVLQKAGADYLNGEAVFVDAHTLAVGDQRVRGKKIILATGSAPLLPPIPGLSEVAPLTNENIFQLEQLPESLLILGGGVISMELAQALNRLGVRCTVVEMLPEVLGREEPEFAALMREKLASEGVVFQLDTKATRVEKTAQGIRLHTVRGTQESTLDAEQILVALGRAPNIKGMGLDTVGIQVDKGVVVNKHLQTSLPHVYACGDVAGPYLLSHMANYQGKIAAMNAVLPLPVKRSVNYQHVTWATFTDPELARAGMTETEARAQYGDRIRVYHYDFAKLDRAQTKAGDMGRIKLITDHRARVLGAHIIAERAGDLIAEVQVLKTLGIPFSKLQGVIHPYPSYADALRQLSQQVFLDRIFQHPVVKLFRSGK
ncbi:dihydrolipoyl dehydrogenase family protein [Salinispirillum marinum]|uniref:Dihydrolipoyl dehydrogenase family protein n=2 Tax=Saccharospirillaceae TaxID=255527 RepID=A0ABV8BDQ4_9GAMM